MLEKCLGWLVLKSSLLQLMPVKAVQNILLWFAWACCSRPPVHLHRLALLYCTELKKRQKHNSLSVCFSGSEWLLQQLLAAKWPCTGRKLKRHRSSMNESFPPIGVSDAIQQQPLQRCEATCRVAVFRLELAVFSVKRDLTNIRYVLLVPDFLH